MGEYVTNDCFYAEKGDKDMTIEEAIKILVRSAICSTHLCETCIYDESDKNDENDFKCSCEFDYNSLTEAIKVLGYSMEERV